jgi:4-amino-4-deoxy-L-arabinose transferase-like glycosyltransferase
MKNKIKIFIKSNYFSSSNLLIYITTIYIAIFFALFFAGKISERCIADECGYIQFSINLINGFYSPPAPDINLWWGPGYPIFLVPFIALGLNRITIVFINVLISLLIIILLYKTSRQYLSTRYSKIVTSIWCLYYPNFQNSFSALSEPLATFLIIFFIYSFVKYFFTKNRLYSMLAGLSLGILVLTKVIFSYVILFLIVLLIPFYFFQQFRGITARIGAMIAVAFLVTVPYQLYTFSLTGKLYYFSNAGGHQLYFMTSPHPGEFGEWNNFSFTANCNIDPVIPCNSDKFFKNHGEIIGYALKLNPVERDNYLKKVALENIRNFPVKYLKNYINNFSRMLFNVPHSYFYQRERTIIRFLSGSFMLTFIIFSLFYSIINFKKLSFSIILIAAFILIYLGVQLLVSAYPRQFDIIVPALLVWFGVVYRTCIFSIKSQH